jgi:outer membrane biosynthesis protein TonB
LQLAYFSESLLHWVTNKIQKVAMSKNKLISSTQILALALAVALFLPSSVIALTIQLNNQGGATFYQDQVLGDDSDEKPEDEKESETEQPETKSRSEDEKPETESEPETQSKSEDEKSETEKKSLEEPKRKSATKAKIEVKSFKKA